MYIEETEAEEILSKDKLIDSICDTINNFNSKDIGNENFNIGFRYAIYKVINLFEEKDKEIERLNNIIKKLERLVDDYAWNSYYIKCGNRYLKSEILNDIREIIELKGSDKSE